MSRSMVNSDSRASVRWRFLALFCLVGLLFSVACQQSATPATKSGKDEVTFRLDWTPNGFHTYAFLALEKGYFDEQNISAKVLEGRGSATSVKLVGNGSDTFATAEGGVLMKGVVEGVPVSMVAILYAKSGNGIIALKDSKITKPQDLIGKSVGMPTGSSQYQIWPAFLKANNLDPQKIRFVAVDVPALIPALLEKKVDAIGIYTPTNVPTAEAAGGKVDSFLFADFGVNTLGVGLIVNNFTLKQNPDLVRRFSAAILKAFEQSRANPDEAVAALKKYNPQSDAALVKKQLIAAFDLWYTKNTEGKKIGWQSDADWDATQEIMVQYGGLKEKSDIKMYFTNDLLPKG